MFRYAEEMFSLGRGLTDTLKDRTYNRSLGRPMPFQVGITNVVPKWVAYRIREPALGFAETVHVICKEDKPERLLAELAGHEVDLVVTDVLMSSSVSIVILNQYYTTQPIERSHVPIHDRLRGTRGLRAVGTGQRFLDSFEAFHALRRGMVKLRTLAPRYRPIQASVHETARAVETAMDVLSTPLKKAAEGSSCYITYSDILSRSIYLKHQTISQTPCPCSRLFPNSPALPEAASRG